MTDPTQRFSNRADEYAKFRPIYPASCIEFLQKEFAIDDTKTIADVGAGTGILSELLLETGARVIGVEPNDDMRNTSRKLIRNERFVAVAGTAEATTLADHTIDLITVAQAFHWIDPIAAKKEFLRILKDPRAIAVMWYIQPAETEFAKRFEQIKEKYGKDYLTIRKSHEPDLKSFFEPYQYEVIRFPHFNILDRQGLHGLIQSSSFMPRSTGKSFDVMSADLNTLFDDFQKNGLIKISYETQLHYGK